MKRFAVALLLLVLPLQYSWAALGVYCQHEGGASAQQHFGHHFHKHEQAGGSDPASGAPSFHPDCALCHLGSTGLLPQLLPPVCAPAPVMVGDGAPHFFLSEVISLPEKPNWIAAS